ncbi:MAG: hypothetical protein LiPW41_666 [Parcubacteria group bacterium LiPW_41]|nr:MAG: hypothetical protein LiPW41_666 [Parcubacteria group bacterium LiPW_41]
MNEKYYFYDINGNEITSPVLFGATVLISQDPLPDFSKNHTGCSMLSKNIPTTTPIGSMITVAFGDPRVFDCKLISFELSDIPDVIENEIGEFLKTEEFLKDEEHDEFITLEREGKKIWALHDFLCLEEDL